MAKEGQVVKKNICTTRQREKNRICEDDKDFNDALMEQSINTKLYMQAPNSPDVNLLDLGFFRAIQSFNDATPTNEEELIQVVSAAYDNYPQNKINCTWLTLQCCFNQIIMHNVDNIEHVCKEKLECTRELPDVLDVVEDAAWIFHTNTNTNDTNDETDDKQTHKLK